MVSRKRPVGQAAKKIYEVHFTNCRNNNLLVAMYSKYVLTLFICNPVFFMRKLGVSLAIRARLLRIRAGLGWKSQVQDPGSA